MSSNFSARLFAFFCATLITIVTFAGCNSDAPSKDVVATVNGRKIMQSELDKYYENQTSGAQQAPQGEQAASTRLSILNEMIDQEILLQRAEKMGLVATDEEVETKLDELKAPYTKEQFEQSLKAKNLTLDDVKKDLRRSLTVQKVLNKEINSKISISDKDISNYYNQHKAEFNVVEPQYHLARIVVTPVPNPQVHNLKNDKAQNPEQARTKIQELLNRLQSGEDFATVAQDYSEDPDTSANGGDMGFLPESSLKQTDPAIRDAVSRLQPGHISGVITVNASKGQQAYLIVKLIGKEPAGQRDLNDPRVQQSIREQLRQSKEQLLRAAYYDEVRDGAKVKNYLAEQILASAGAAK